MATSQFELFSLATDNPDELLTILRTTPSLASSQDDNGYSLVHAAASYNQLDLLRALVEEFHVNVDLKDEDGETALFVAESREVARLLVEELGANIHICGNDGMTARERLEEEDEFPELVAYLRLKELEASAGLNGVNGNPELPAPPQGALIVNGHDLATEIEELAQQENFNDDDGQEALRALITDALRRGTGRENQ